MALLIIVAAAIPVSWFLYVKWGTHLEMVGEFCPTWRWGTFNDFKRMYSKKTWRQEKQYPDSHFADGGEIHASIISFDGVGMKLDPVSFFFFEIWCERNSISRHGDNIGGGWE